MAQNPLCPGAPYLGTELSYPGVPGALPGLTDATSASQIQVPLAANRAAFRTVVTEGEGVSLRWVEQGGPLKIYP